MDFVATARQLVCNIIAAVLSMTVAAVDALFASRPELMEQVNQLAMQLRTTASDSRTRAPRAVTAFEPSDDTAEFEEAEEPHDLDEEIEIDTDQLLLAYNQLWQFVHDLRSEGISLDEKFCERIEREWSVTTLLTYIRNVDRSIQENAGVTLQSAAAFIHNDG